MSISIDDYFNSVNAITAAAQNAVAAGSTNQTNSTSSEKDSYIASGIDDDTVFPCDNYNDILEVIKNSKAEQSAAFADSDTDTGSGTESASGETGTGSVGTAGGSGGSGDEDSEDETTTKVVTINGVTYLEITTVSNGITTVTRTELSAS